MTASLRPTTIDTFLRDVAAVDVIDPSSVIAVGTVLDGCYELRERLGAGGMATVYRAYDRRLHREVAIKVPRLDRGDRARITAMFEREARATARLRHPNIVALHHIGNQAGTPFAVLELLTGETLAERLARRGALPAIEALPILDGVLQALAYAHDRGIVHRDLTPRNVFLTGDQRVMLLDFGVAVECGLALSTRTRAAGTPGYMAPEHAAAPDPRNDLWAAGVLFLECVTGMRPRADGSELPDLPAELPRRVRAAIERAVAPDPDLRQQTAGDLRLALAPALGARRIGWWRRVERAVARRPWLAGLALICAGLAAAGGAWWLLDARAATPGATLPRDGRWRGDPQAGTPWETTLQRLDDTHFAYRNDNRLTGSAMAGTLTVERLSDGTTLLSGKTALVEPCTDCNDVGFIEFIILDETHIYQNRSAYGRSHDSYAGWFPPYRYKWEGTLRDAAR